MEEMGDKRISLIPMDLISENPFQPRKTFDEQELSELAESIKTHGLIQPVILRKVGERYQIVAGERRIRACRSLGRNEIPAIVVEIDGADVAEVSLVENIQRKNLNCLEEAEAFHIMKTRFGMTAEEIAQKIGKSRPYVSNTLRLIGLHDSVKKELIAGTVSMGHGRALLALDEFQSQESTLETIIKDALSVRQTEDLVASLLDKAKGGKKDRGRKADSRNAMADALQDYYESLKGIIKNIKKSGGKIDIVERESENYFEYTIRIPR